MPALTDAIQKIITNADGTFSIIYNQPEAVTTVFILFFVGLEAIAGLVYAVMLLPVTVEKTVDKKLVIIRARQRAACEARGEAWAEPEVRAAEEQKRLDAEAEEYYRKELKERCQKKGSDYEAELAKHTEALRAKAEKERAAKVKAAKQAERLAQKREAKLAAMTPEQARRAQER